MMKTLSLFWKEKSQKVNNQARTLNFPFVYFLYGRFHKRSTDRVGQLEYIEFDLFVWTCRWRVCVSKYTLFLIRVAQHDGRQITDSLEYSSLFNELVSSYVLKVLLVYFTSFQCTCRDKSANIGRFRYPTYRLIDLAKCAKW